MIWSGDVICDFVIKRNGNGNGNGGMDLYMVVVVL